MNVGRAKSTKRLYLLALAASCVGSLCLVAAFNAIVDPYGIFNSPRIDGFNAVKPRPRAWIADIKLAAALNASADTVIIGNSRAEIGFDPQSAVLAGRNTYNLAVPGLGLASNIEMLSDIAKRRPPRLLLVGVEYLDFVDSTTPPQKRSAGLMEREPVRAALLRFRALFTLQATLDALETLRIQRTRFPASLTVRGFNPLADYEAVAKNEGYYALFRQRAEEAAKALRRKAAQLPSDPIDPMEVERLRQLLREARDWNAEVHLIIYPYHAQMLMMFQESGLWPAFERFKETLVDEVVAARAAGCRVTLWDFSGRSRYATQPIPQPGDRTMHSAWYWEAGHFKKELGDVMLARVLSGRPAPDDSRFGLILDAGSWKEHLLRQREELALLRQTDPALNAEVRALLVSVEAVRSPSKLP